MIIFVINNLSSTAFYLVCLFSYQLSVISRFLTKSTCVFIGKVQNLKIEKRHILESIMGRIVSGLLAKWKL